MECYFDNSATTRCLDAATQQMVKLLSVDFGNPSSLHNKGMEAEQYTKEARETISRILKVEPKEIFFTSGGTESNNLAIIGSAMANKRSGMHIITTAIEHPSVSNPMAFLEENGFEVTYLGVDEYGLISLEELSDALREDTILVSIMAVNNEIGAVEPIAEIGAIIKKFNQDIIFHVDAIQAFGKIELLPKKANIDLLSVSGHKIHGPKGSGFLYIKNKTKVKPIIHGGGQEWGYRSGTENVPAISALSVAAKYANDNLAKNQAHMFMLRDALIDGLSKLDGVKLNGKLDHTNACHILSVSVSGVRAEVLLHSLEDKGIYVSAGSACSSNKPAISKTLLAIGVEQKLLDSTVRFSFCEDNTIEQVEYALSVMNELIPMLQKYTRH